MIYTSIPKRKPKKPNAAQRQLAAEWEAICKKYEPKKPIVKKSSTLQYTLSTPPGRTTTKHIPSLNSGDMGVASSKPRQQYTGTKMIGIGTLHKSNAVPVFSDEEAIDMAKMRRG